MKKLAFTVLILAFCSCFLQGPTGPAGADGADGNTMLTGSYAPSPGLGSSGDYYMDTVYHSLYGPKTITGWGVGTNLVGPQGVQGATGPTLDITVATGTIYNLNYKSANSSAASIHLPNATENTTVLSFGVQNSNSVYIENAWNGIIYGGSDTAFAVSGTSGYYLLITDPSKTLLLKNYQVKYIQ